MAAMFLTRSALFRFSKSLPYAPSLSLSNPPGSPSPPFPTKTVCSCCCETIMSFIMITNRYLVSWRSAEEEEGRRDGRTDWIYDSAEADEMTERAKETMIEGYDRAKDQEREAKDRTKEYTHDAKDKTEEYAYDTKESDKDDAGKVVDKSREGAERTKEKTEEVAASAGETLRNVGEKAKQGMQGAWETAKDTTQKIKETVVGKDDDDDGRGVLKDEDVVEMKRRVGKSYGEKGY
ncbi:Uncharacterized protein HKD37_15G042055 [Glycine soja]